MIAIFGVAFFFGLIAAVVSGIVWIVQRLRHRQTRARVVCIVAALVTVIGIVGIGVMYEPPDKVEEPPVVDNTEPAQDGTQSPTETPAATSTPVITPEPEDTPQGATEPPETTQTPEPVPVNLPVQERPVMNGTGTERIGTWACISTTKEYLLTISGQALYDHLENMTGSNYNWVNVIFGDGTGLYCYMDGYMIEYGCVDEAEGGAVEPGDGVDVRYFHFDEDTGTYVEYE